jgi:hypothetical protein
VPSSRRDRYAHSRVSQLDRDRPPDPPPASRYERNPASQLLVLHRGRA